MPAAIGTGAWSVALIVLLVMGDSLPDSERWWIGVCVTGIALGVFGFLYIPHLLHSRGERAEHAAGRTEDRSKAP